MFFVSSTEMTRNCTWCGERIDPDGEFKTVVDGAPNRDAYVVAVFHDDDRPCFSEAADYGWR